MTQRQRVLERLQSGAWLSTVDAVEMHILRLGAIICNLKKETTPFGKPKWDIVERRKDGKAYSEYHLRKGPTVVLPPAYKESPVELQRRML